MLQSVDQGKGIGTQLLKMAIRNAYDNNMKYIMLDDNSDNFGKPEKNIYVKLGLKYIKKGEPEMKGRISNLI